MTDEDQDETIDAVASDENIYAVLEPEMAGVVVNEDNDRPDLPDFHGVEKIAIDGTKSTIRDIDRRWVVGREHNQIEQDFEVWVPRDNFSVEIRTDLSANMGLFELHDPPTAITVGTDVDNHYSTELFWLSAGRLQEAYDEPVTQGETQHIPPTHSVFETDQGIVSSIPDHHVDNNGEWIRGADTMGRGSTTNYEIFVPVDEFELVNEETNPQILFTENSITRKDGREMREPITQRQSGLYIDQIQAVSEDAVPDVDGSYDEGTVYNPNGEQ